MSQPRVTVLMSVHNGGRWLRAAIASVLAQTFRNFEFLIVDDASTDDSVAQVEAFDDPRIRLLRLPENVGLTRSLNAGLHAARGELVARQDADDLSTPDRLERQIAFLDAHSHVPLVGAQARLIDSEGRSRGARDLPLEPVSLRWLSLLDNPVIHSAAMFRTALVREKFGGYDESFSTCQDYDLWTRMMTRHPAANLPARLVALREHGGSISATRQEEGRTMVRRVVSRVLAELLPEFTSDAGAVETLCAYRRHLTPAEIPPFLALLEKVDAAFEQRFPEAATSDDLALTRAAVFARIGYNVLTRDRRAALRMFRAAVRTSPQIVGRIPWLRVAALGVLGGSARTLFERVRQ